MSKYFLFLLLLSMSIMPLVSGGALFVTNQYTQPNFHTYYSGSVSTYWPILNEREQCLARQDLLLQVAPAGCQPAVVRSDLLAEQNVPVFCQLNALQINPLVNIKELESMRFTGSYPKEVSGVGFHPARAALRTRDQLLGDPLVNNVGYVVIILKKQPKEAELPESVKLTLSANVKYDAGNALGAGKSEFLLSEQSDVAWEQAQKEGKQSFFNGKYQVRLEDADVQGGTIGIYSGKNKLGESRLEQGKQAPGIFLPGSYCKGEIKAELLGYEIAKDRATLRIVGTYGTETVDVYQGSTFLQGQCRVQRLTIDNRTGRTGSVEVKCSSAPAFKLSLLSSAGTYELFANPADPEKLLLPDASGMIDFGTRTPDYQSGTFRVNEKGDLEHNGAVVSLTKSDEQTKWYRILRDALREYVGAVKAQGTTTGGTAKAPKALRERQYSPDVEANFSATIKAYQEVAKQYPAERQSDVQGITPYGEEALARAARLAGSYGKQATQAVLLQELLTTYPDSNSFSEYQRELDQLNEVDGSQASAVLSVQNAYRTITLVGLAHPTQMPSVDFMISNQPVRLLLGENTTLGTLGGSTRTTTSTRSVTTTTSIPAFIKLTAIDADKITLTTNCAYDIRRAGSASTSPSSSTRAEGGSATSVYLGEQDDGTICGQGIRVATINAEKLARVRLTTTAERTESTTNLTVQIGIEKRAIQLSPAKTAERIANLNASIKRWEQLNKNLEKVVTTMKAACFATAGVLTVKNFFTGLSGKGFARKEAMSGEHGWTEKCRQEIALPGSTVRTFDQCYLKHASEIEADVEARHRAVQAVNTKVNEIQKNSMNPSSGLFGDSVNTDEAAKKYREFLKTDTYFSDTVKDIDLEQASYTQLRELHMNLLLQQQGATGLLQDDANAKIAGIKESITAQEKLVADLKKNDELAKKGGVKATVVSPNSALPRVGSVSSELTPDDQAKWGVATKYYTDVVATQSNYNVNTQDSLLGSSSGKQLVSGTFGGTYRLGLTKQADGTYVTDKVYTVNSNGEVIGEVQDEAIRAELLKQYNLQSFRDASSETWDKYRMNKTEVLYFETDPYKGLPALVPVDPEHGWYAATKQTLPAFGGLAGWESSGKVASFYLCNVGKNGRADAFNGYNDDSCVLIYLASGQPAEKVPGVSEARATQLVRDARSALEEAARAHQQGVKRVTIKGRTYEVGKPAVSVPAVECQTFMSPQECNLLFNVCDPVICPSSRCNFGGKYPVQDVIQSGIIGSILLCLPNFPDVKIPMCLSGIHAGIDAYTSILQAHRDCLQESLTSGRMVGICDQIYSINSCEFFWRQMSPLANLVVPKLFEQAQGQGVRGGGEYLTVQNAWQNAKQSTDYFTQVYGVNAFKAFQARSTEEVGGEMCKSFISARFPSSFKSLIQADSPVQYHAYFSTIKFTDATVPATSQYKVFYHLYAGKDSGVSYRVYLKNPPATSYYASQPTIPVASGFIGKGQTKDETKDFTAPEGYQQLCVVVNGNENCGFKQVSTSFAVNQLRDQIVQDELQNKNIKTESECVSGAPNAAALLNPNFGQMADELADPALYRRGIIRICASSNPGQTTDPSRFSEVGICGDPKLKCWLDSQSIKDAITPNNQGVLNETYQWFANNTLANLQRDGRVLGAEAGQAELSRLEGVVSGFESKNARLAPADLTRLSQLFMEFAQTKEALFFNHHRARLGWLVGRAMEVLLKDMVAGRADETRQAGQLIGGTILVRENNKVWEIRSDKLSQWIPVSTFLNNNEDYTLALSDFQKGLLEELLTPVTDTKEQHLLLFNTDGVTVDSNANTQTAVYSIPYGDAVSPAGRTPDGKTPPSTPLETSSEIFFRCDEMDGWQWRFANEPTKWRSLLDTKISSLSDSYQVLLNYLQNIRDLDIDLNHKQWYAEGYALLYEQNYESHIESGTCDTTGVIVSTLPAKKPSSLSATTAQLFTQGFTEDLAKICFIDTGAPAVAGASGALSASIDTKLATLAQQRAAQVIALEKELNAAKTILIKSGVSVTNRLTGSIVGAIAHEGGKMVVKSGTDVLAFVELAEGLQSGTALFRSPTGAISPYSVSKGALLVDGAGNTLGFTLEQVNEAHIFLKDSAGKARILSRTTQLGKYVAMGGRVLGSIATGYSLLCSAYSIYAINQQMDASIIAYDQETTATLAYETQWIERVKRLRIGIEEADQLLKEQLVRTSDLQVQESGLSDQQRASLFFTWPSFLANLQELITQVDVLRVEVSKFIDVYNVALESSTNGARLSKEEDAALWVRYRTLYEGYRSLSLVAMEMYQEVNQPTDAGSLVTIPQITPAQQPTYYLSSSISTSGEARISSVGKREYTNFYIVYQPETRTDANNRAYQHDYVLKLDINWARDLTVGDVDFVILTSDGRVWYQIKNINLQTIFAKIPSAQRESAIKYSRQLNNAYIVGTDIFSTF